MIFRRSAPPIGSCQLQPVPLRSAVIATLLAAAMSVVAAGRASAEPAGPRQLPFSGGFKAISRALGGTSGKTPPKQASRLPLPPDAHEDDALVSQLLKRPIAEAVPIGPPPTAAKKPSPERQENDAATTPSTSSKTSKSETARPTKQPAAAKKPPEAEPAGKNQPQPPRIESFDDLAALASAFGQAAKTIVTASLDPGYRSVAAKPASPPRPPAPTARNVATTRVAETPAPTKKQAGPIAWTSEGTATPPPVNDRMNRLKRRVEQVLATYKRRPLNTQDHTPWEVMHSFLAFGIGTDVRVGGPRGGLVNAIGWVNSGGRCRGQTMLATQDGRITALKGIGLQGHSAQYLAILAQCRVAANSPLTPQRQSFTVADLIEQEKLDCKSKTELTFALIGLAHYLPTDATWTARDGQPWSLERLVAEELEQPIRGAPCGGTHRLFGLAYGCQRRLRATGSLEGTYARADAFVREYQLMTLTKLQNADGSFSTEWYKFPTAQNREDDIDRKIQTTGHMLEWLVASLDQESLYHGRVTRAVEFLAWSLASEPDREWAVGPMCHALHALSVYQERVWGTVLPGAVAAFKGPMKAAAPRELQVAETPESKPADDGSPATESKRRVRR